MEKQKNIPKLRFPNFEGDWRECRLSDFLIRYSETNSDEEFGLDDILSLSSHHGVVSRKQLLEDTYKDVNHLNYKKTRLNDFVYGKSISASYPFGLFKVNDFKDGLLSTLYFTFKVKDFVYPKFLDCYFSQLTRTNNFLRKFVLVGDRYITAEADYLLSGKIYIPTQKEYQQKIASFFTAIDQKIAQLMRKKFLLEQYKKGVIQKIFSQELRFKDDYGQDFPKWENKRLGELAVKVTEKNKGNHINLVLTNSAVNGIVSQRDFFEKDIANQNNLLNYYIVNIDDFIYNPRISSNAPVGPIKRNRISIGVMSPLYTVFKFHSGNLSYCEFYFSTTCWHNYMNSIANFGARSDRMNITTSDFFQMPLPFPCIEEQTKIANFLSAIDNKINHIKKQIEKTEDWKKGLMQQMFC